MSDTDKPNTNTDLDMSPIARVLFGWVGYKHTGNIIFALVGLACIVMTGIDAALHRHEYFEEAEFISFYGIYGFLAFGFVVLMGWPLGYLLRRGENYYGDADIDPNEDLTEIDEDDAL